MSCSTSPSTGGPYGLTIVLKNRKREEDPALLVHVQMGDSLPLIVRVTLMVQRPMIGRSLPIRLMICGERTWQLPSQQAKDKTAILFAVDHCSMECMGIHAARHGTRFEALEPIR